MEEIYLHYDQINKNKFYDLKDIIFECFGNNPALSCQFSGTTTKLAIVYDFIYIKCYINSVHYGPGVCYYQDNGWRLYKQYRLVSIPDIPFIKSELKKYERLMMIGKCGISCSDTYGVDLIINILKLVVNNKKEKDKDKETEKEIELLKLRIRDEEQISQLYRSKIKTMTLDISEEEEMREADIKANYLH